MATMKESPGEVVRPSLILLVSCGAKSTHRPTDALGAGGDVLRSLEEGGFRVEAATSQAEAEALFRAHHHALVLLDLDRESAPRGALSANRDTQGDDGTAEALATLHSLRAADSLLPVVVLADRSETRNVARAIEQGAFDWIAKPVDPHKLVGLVSALIARRGALVTPISLEGGLREEPNFRKIVGSSEKIGDVFQSIEVVKASDVPVLIEGETGTGKELVAMAIHYRGPRRKCPFFPVNCAAIPETLLESELFGHERGSFTGASERRKGKFEMANGGTLFLDEIAEMPPATQAKILRVIEDHTFRRIGGAELIQVDVRIVSATNRDLRKEVAAGRFREDLFYRLSVFPIHLPALRERKKDIEELAYYFLQKSSTETGKTVTQISPAALAVMQAYPWPGNVRELQNTIKRAALLSSEGVIEPAHLNLQAPPTGDFVFSAASDVEQEIARLLAALQRGEIVRLDRIEEIFIRQALSVTDNNITDAANRLGVSRSTIYRKLQEYGVAAPKGLEGSGDH